MKNFILVSILSVTFLSSCKSTNVWYNKNSTIEISNKDFNECSLEANSRGNVSYGGFTSAMDAGIQTAVLTNTLMTNCMQARGYSLENGKVIANRNSEIKSLVQKIVDSFNSDNYDEMESHIQAHEARYGNRQDFPIYRGYAFANYGKYSDAIKQFDLVKSEQSEYTYIQAIKAIFYSKLGDNDIAIVIADNLPLKHPTSAVQLTIYTAKSYVYSNSGDFDTGLEYANKSIAVDSSSPFPYRNKALALTSTSKEASLLNIKKSIALATSDNSNLFDDFGNIYTLLEDYDEAEKWYKKACEIGNVKSCSALRENVSNTKAE